MTKKDYQAHMKAIDEMFWRHPELRVKIEQLRQARSRHQGREVSFNEMFVDLVSAGAKKLLAREKLLLAREQRRKR